MKLRLFENFDDMSDYRAEQFAAEFADELAHMGHSVTFDGNEYDARRQRNTIKLMVDGTSLEIEQDWSKDGSETKPVTTVSYKDMYINLGRFAIFSPEQYAEDIMNAIKEHSN